MKRKKGLLYKKYSMYSLSDIHFLTLIQMAGGLYGSHNFEKITLKMAFSKNIF